MVLCTARVRAWQNPLPQTLHLNGFSFKWMYLQRCINHLQTKRNKAQSKIASYRAATLITKPHVRKKGFKLVHLHGFWMSLFSWILVITWAEVHLFGVQKRFWSKLKLRRKMCDPWRSVPVISQVILPPERLATNFARVWSLIGVSTLVNQQVVGFGELSPAKSADKFFLWSGWDLTCIKYFRKAFEVTPNFF